MAKIRLRYVRTYRDRHGKLRRYLRRPGHAGVPLPGLPGSPEFMAAYQAAIAGPQPERPASAPAGSLKALVIDFHRSVEFANLAPSSKRNYRLVLAPIVAKDGHRLVRDLPPDKARKIIEEIGATKPGMANLTRAVLRRLMEFAISKRFRTDNPFARVPIYKLGSRHTWTDEELAAYEARWPLGTRERLAYAALLYTLQRVGDVAKMRRPAPDAATIAVKQQKTGIELSVAIHPSLLRAIKAGPALGVYLIGDAQGRPVTGSTVSAIVGAAAVKAGLDPRCVAHGLRKAGMRRLAEHGSTSKEIAAMSGHKTLNEVERYTEKADQARLARAAIAKLPDER